MDILASQRNGKVIIVWWKLKWNCSNDWTFENYIAFIWL